MYIWSKWRTEDTTIFFLPRMHCDTYVKSTKSPYLYHWIYLYFFDITLLIMSRKKNKNYFPKASVLTLNRSLQGIGDPPIRCLTVPYVGARHTHRGIRRVYVCSLVKLWKLFWRFQPYEPFNPSLIHILKQTLQNSTQWMLYVHVL